MARHFDPHDNEIGVPIYNHHGRKFSASPWPANAAGHFTSSARASSIPNVSWQSFDASATNQSVAQGSPISNQTIAADNYLSFNSAAFYSDADGDVLSFSNTLAGGSALPAWLQTNALGQFYGTAPASAAGQVYQINQTVTDLNGAQHNGDLPTPASRPCRTAPSAAPSAFRSIRLAAPEPARRQQQSLKTAAAICSWLTFRTQTAPRRRKCTSSATTFRISPSERRCWSPRPPITSETSRSRPMPPGTLARHRLEPRTLCYPGGQRLFRLHRRLLAVRRCAGQQRGGSVIQLEFERKWRPGSCGERKR